MLQNIFNFYLFENPLTLEFRMWIFQVIYIFPTFRFYILQKRSEIIDYTFSFYFYCCLAGVKYLKCYLISLALSFFRKHSSNSASSLYLLIIGKTLLSCNSSLICSISLWLKPSTLYMHIVSTKSWEQMVVIELMQGMPALYLSFRSTIAAKGSSNLKISFNLCCSSKSARSSIVGLISDSSVLTSKLHTELLRNMTPAEPELVLMKLFSRIFRIPFFQASLGCAVGNSYLVVYETK